MAVTVAQLAQAIRVGSTAQETAQVERLQTVAEQIISNYANEVPEAIEDEAVIRIVGYLYDAPTTAYANALTNSGAASLLLPYRTIRAGKVEGSETAPSSSGNQVDEERLIPPGGTDGQVLAKASNDDYDTEWETVQASGSGTVDQTARATADEALAATVTNKALIDNNVINISANENAGLPQGGTSGQVLTKKTNLNYDAEWVTNEAVSNADVQKNTNSIELIHNTVDHITEITRNLYPVSRDGYKIGTRDADGVGIAWARGTSVSLQTATGLSYTTGNAMINADLNGAGTAWRRGVLIVRALKADSRPLSQYRIGLQIPNVPTYYYSGTQLEDLEATTGAWDYYALNGTSGSQLSSDVESIVLQIHEDNITNYLGQIAGLLASELIERLLPAGGAINQILSKKTADDYDAHWINAPSGGGSASAPTLLASFTRDGSDLMSGFDTNTTRITATYNALRKGGTFRFIVWDGANAGNESVFSVDRWYGGRMNTDSTQTNINLYFIGTYGNSRRPSAFRINSRSNRCQLYYYQTPTTYNSEIYQQRANLRDGTANAFQLFQV